MEPAVSPGAVMVTIAGRRISQQTIEESLKASGLGNVEVTWTTTERRDDADWHITVVTRHKVAVGALPSGRQNASELAAYLIEVLRDV
jgi:hypothetical protein